jgi:hypothetical protein
MDQSQGPATNRLVKPGTVRKHVGKVKGAVRMMVEFKLSATERDHRQKNLAKQLFKNVEKMDKGLLMGKYYVYMSKQKNSMNVKDKMFLAVGSNNLVEFEDMVFFFNLMDIGQYLSVDCQ